MSIGIITAAVILIIGYVAVTRLIGLAFRIAVPLILILVLGGAGAVSGLMPDREPGRYPVDRFSPYEPARHRRADDIGDLTLRDLANTVVDGVQTVLRGTLDLIENLSGSGQAPERSWDDRPPRMHQGSTRPVPPHFEDDPREWEARPGR